MCVDHAAARSFGRDGVNGETGDDRKVGQAMSEPTFTIERFCDELGPGCHGGTETAAFVQIAEKIRTNTQAVLARSP